MQLREGIDEDGFYTDVALAVLAARKNQIQLLGQAAMNRKKELMANMDAQIRTGAAELASSVASTMQQFDSQMSGAFSKQVQNVFNKEKEAIGQLTTVGLGGNRH